MSRRRERDGVERDPQGGQVQRTTCAIKVGTLLKINFIKTYAATVCFQNET